MRARHIVLRLAVLMAAAAPASASADPLPHQVGALFAMTPDQFAAAADVKDDALETVATISTMRGWQQHDGLLRIVNDDGFFRAFIDKTSGETRFQVYHMVRYTEQHRARFEVVNYETPDGPVSVPLIPSAATADRAASMSGARISRPSLSRSTRRCCARSRRSTCRAGSRCGNIA